MAHPATDFSTYAPDPHLSPCKFSSPAPQLYHDTASLTQPTFQKQLLSLHSEQLDPALSLPIDQLPADEHMFMSLNHDRFAAQTAAPWPNHIDTAMNEVSNGLPAAQYQFAPENQLTYSNQNFDLDHGQENAAAPAQNMAFTSNGLPTEEYQLAPENEPTYADPKYALDHGQMNAAASAQAIAQLKNGHLVSEHDPSVAFVMMEEVPVIVEPDGSDVDAEGESDDDAGVVEQDSSITMPSSDPDYHANRDENKQKFILRLSNLQKHLQPSPKRTAANGEEKAKEVDDSSTTQSPVATREGKRKRTSTKFFDDVAEEVETVGRPRKRTRLEDDYVDPESSPPVILHKRGHPPKQNNRRATRVLSTEEDEHTHGSSKSHVRDLDPSPKDPFHASIPDGIIQAYELISGGGYKRLPDFHELQGGKPKVWTAKDLTLLYIHSYAKDDAELCDIIADVWIRAFQDLARDRKRPHIWRINKHHSERKNYEDHGLPDVSEWQKDPAYAMPTKYDQDVTDFDPKLLNRLHHHTTATSGARMLWADSMALCGSKAEDYFINAKKQKVTLHEDLMFNVMCTSLRMARRHLTLKIEEVGEECWCARYHMHSSLGQPCYRSEKVKPREKAREVPAAKRQQHRFARLTPQAPAPAPAAQATVGGGEIGDEGDELEQEMLRGFETMEEEDQQRVQEARPERHVQFALPGDNGDNQSGDDDEDEVSEEE